MAEYHYSPHITAHSPSSGQLAFSEMCAALHREISLTEFISLRSGNSHGFSRYLGAPDQNENGYGFLEFASIQLLPRLLLYADAITHAHGLTLNTPTPLTPFSRLSEINHSAEVFVKDESGHPTGSFKDRQNQVLFAIAEALGISSVRIVSSGNAAISAAFFGRLHGIEVRAAVAPNEIPRAKRELLEASGCKVDLIGECYEDAFQKTLNETPHTWNISPGINPFVELGLARIGYELLQAQPQLSHVVATAGNGALLYGIWLGMRLFAAEYGLPKLPQIHGVQMSGFAPIKRAFDNGSYHECLDVKASPHSEAFLIKESYCAPKALRALKSTGGSVLEVSEDDLRVVGLVLKRCGLNTEYAALSAFAGAQLLIQQGRISGKVAILNCAGELRGRKLALLS